MGDTFMRMIKGEATEEEIDSLEEASAAEGYIAHARAGEVRRAGLAHPEASRRQIKPEGRGRKSAALYHGRKNSTSKRLHHILKVLLGCRVAVSAGSLPAPVPAFTGSVTGPNFLRRRFRPRGTGSFW